MLRLGCLLFGIALLSFSACGGEEFSSGSGGAGATGGSGGATACQQDEKRCGGACVARDLPEYGCGRPECDACQLPKATPTCAAGACAVAQCLGTFADCDGESANGCETNLNTSTDCGVCGKQCPTGQVCNGGQCADGCGSLLECNGGCVDVQSDIAHCGGCNQSCDPPLNADSPACVGASCTYQCITGYDNCDTSSPDCESSIQTDPANCTGCGIACPPPPPGAVALECNNGCVCSGGLTACGDTTIGACIDVSSEPQACGSCETECAHGQWCNSALCTGPPQCAFGMRNCGGTCVSTESDPNNCGVCGTNCGTGMACKGGSCVLLAACTSPNIVCTTGTDGAHCPHPLLDPRNCGSCGNACDAGSACIGGSCQGLTLTNQAWICKFKLNVKACLVPNAWPTQPNAQYFCATQCPWGEAG